MGNICSFFFFFSFFLFDVIELRIFEDMIPDRWEFRAYLPAYKFYRVYRSTLRLAAELNINSLLWNWYGASDPVVWLPSADKYIAANLKTARRKKYKLLETQFNFKRAAAIRNYCDQSIKLASDTWQFSSAHITKSFDISIVFKNDVISSKWLVHTTAV